MTLPLVRAALAIVALTLAAASGRANAESMAMDQSHGRYAGAPDLALTSAMIAAGGGPRHFSSERLSGMLAATGRTAEVAHLRARYGDDAVNRYFATFDAFVGDAIHIATREHIRLPRPNPALAHDSYELAASLRADGVMPDGRFDVGYFLEHLLSRPMHVQLMHDADASPTIGPATNAEFHVILTAEMNDLCSLYRLPH